MTLINDITEDQEVEEEEKPKAYIAGMPKEPLTIWKDGRQSIILKLKKGKTFKRLELGNKYIPDIDQKNNSFIFNN